MSGTRNGAMTTVGILNIVFGAIGTLMSLLVILGGGLLAVGSAAAEANGDPELAGVGAIGTLGGAIIVAMGVLGVVCGALLLFSGVGVLKVSPWGRTLCIVSGLGLFIINGLSILGEFGFMNMVMLCYGGLITVLCFTQDWKNRFAGLPATAGASAPSASSLDAPIAGDTSPSFAVIPPAGSTPAAEPAEPEPAASLHPAPAVARGLKGGDAEGFAGIPGMPPPPDQPASRFGKADPNAAPTTPSGDANQGDEDDNDRISEVAA